MFPTPDQIRLAAYHRWRRRGSEHGGDLDDWSAAEHDLLFALNYEVVAHYRLDAPAEQALGDQARRVCRYCEQAAPQTEFAGPVPALPVSLGNTSLVVYDECEECRALFEESTGEAFEAFRRAILEGPTSPSIPLAAYKALTRMALAILPVAELEYVPDAIEWVLNPDHGLDGGVFGALGCYLHRLPAPFAFPWAALARRTDDDAPMPYLLFVVGTGDIAFEIAVPLCQRDEDHDGTGLIIPQAAAVERMGGSDLRGTCVFLPTPAADARPVATPVGGRPVPPIRPSLKGATGWLDRLVERLPGGRRGGHGSGRGSGR